jgi:Zn-dependent peptidase ImmA (M78 family)/transcriptional regulator with XRE-family HTH domain
MLKLELKQIENIMKDNELASIYDLLPEYESENLIEAVTKKYVSLGLTKNQFCHFLGIDKTSWERIISGKHQKLDVPMLLKISQFLEIDIQQAIDMYVKHSPSNIKQELETIKKNNFLTNYFDLKSLKKIGFIKTIQDLKSIEEKIIEFFQIEELSDYLIKDIRPLFSQTKIKSSDKMLMFWNRIVLEQIKTIQNPYPFDERKLLSIVPKMRGITADVENGFNKFIHALFECGVTVIVETYISKSGIRGGTFSYKDKPFIVLTNIFQRYPTLWFTLAHEICHVINDFEYITHQGYHLTGEANLLTDVLQEETADRFAERLFISDENAQSIEKFISFEEMVNKYAQAWNVHKSFIYARYLNEHQNPNEWKKYQKYLINSSVAIKNIEVVEPWTKTTIRETVERISQSLHRAPIMQS